MLTKVYLKRIKQKQNKFGENIKKFEKNNKIRFYIVLIVQILKYCFISSEKFLQIQNFKSEKVIFEQLFRINYKQYQMRKSSNIRQSLPTINSSQHSQPKKIKDLLSVLKQKRAELQERIIRTEANEEEEDQQQIEEKAFKPYNMRERVITEIPCYEHKKQMLKKTMRVSAMNEMLCSRHSKLSSSVNRQKSNQILPVAHRTRKQTQSEDIQLESEDRQEATVLSKETRRKISNLMPLPHEDQKLSLKKQAKIETQRFMDVFYSVPHNPMQRNDANIKDLMAYLVENNMFFTKISPIIATCFLKLNPLICLEKNDFIYRVDQPCDSFYIILSGRVKLTKIQTNFKKFKKICNPGETIAQQLIFSKNFNKKVLENAKCIGKCFLVEVKLQQYQKMRQQMMRYGYKLIFQEMQSIIKRNYIMKNWQRTQNQKYIAKKK